MFIVFSGSAGALSAASSTVWKPPGTPASALASSGILREGEGDEDEEGYVKVYFCFVFVCLFCMSLHV